MILIMMIIMAIASASNSLELLRTPSNSLELLGTRDEEAEVLTLPCFLKLLHGLFNTLLMYI